MGILPDDELAAYVGGQLAIIDVDPAPVGDAVFVDLVRRHIRASVERLNNLGGTDPVWSGTNRRPTVYKPEHWEARRLAAEPANDEARWARVAFRLLRCDYGAEELLPLVERDPRNVRWIIGASEWLTTVSGPGHGLGSSANGTFAQGSLWCASWSCRALSIRWKAAGRRLSSWTASRSSVSIDLSASRLSRPASQRPGNRGRIAPARAPKAQEYRARARRWVRDIFQAVGRSFDPCRGDRTIRIELLRLYEQRVGQRDGVLTHVHVDPRVRRGQLGECAGYGRVEG